MKRVIPIAMMSAILLIPACKQNDSNANFPDDFNSRSDARKVAYMMENASADSVARFIIYAALGKIEGVSIDTLNNATLTAYEAYTDTALQTFSWEFDRVSEELPLPDKMKLRMLVGAEDPQGLGLTLGLEYMNQIRIKGMSAEEVMAELSQLKKACADNPDVYARFMIGFHTVLRYDKNSDMPREIYEKFLNYDQEAIDAYHSRNKAATAPAPADTAAADLPQPQEEAVTDSID
ncbi:MAG: hypothetical protein Q4C37_08690 [Bacteroidales bacterium]|nr:hypothetical protein [Bacteroidales bacterium]